MSFAICSNIYSKPKNSNSRSAIPKHKKSYSKLHPYTWLCIKEILVIKFICHAKYIHNKTTHSHPIRQKTASTNFFVAPTKKLTADRPLVKLLYGVMKADTFNTLSRSITRIMTGHKVRTAILAALTERREEVRKLHIKPKEAGAFHFLGYRNVRVFHASRVITAPYHEHTREVSCYKNLEEYRLR